MAEFKRDPAREAAAIARGITKEEIERRGGLNASGYYGDTYDPNTSLSDEEYAAAIAGKTGLDVGKAINAALEAKALKNKPVITQGTGTVTKTEDQIAADERRAEGQAKRQSAYDLLYEQFDAYGLGSLVAPLKDLITSGVSDSEFTIKLRETPAYQTRFAANKKRIANGFAAIDEATYLDLEDTFQTLSQNYGMPAKYYAKNSLGTQPYFEEAIANNVDAITFEDRVMEGKKVLDANKFTIDAAKQFYPTLNDGDFLAYILDTKNGLSDIRRKITSAEIGGAQLGAGLAATAAGATELAKAGITGQAYQKAAATIAEDTMRGGQLAAIYKQDPYTQQTAEANILNLPGSAAAKKQTETLEKLENAAFSGRAGLGALARDRAGVL
jgi:hypothetical protein